MYKNSITHYVAKIMIDVMFYGGIAGIFLLQFIAGWLKDYGYAAADTLPYMITMYLSAICAVFIIYNLKLMFKTLLGGNPFIDKNVRCLRMIAVASAIIAAIYLIKCIFVFTFASMALALVFIIGCLFCLTLKDIFKQAVAFKEENDLTI